MKQLLERPPVPSPPGTAPSPLGPPRGTSEGATVPSPPGLRGEIAFALTLVGIVVMLLFELAKNALSFLVFLLRRSRHRERVRKLILTALALFFLLAPGCALRKVAQESRAPSEGKGSPTS